MFLHFLLTIEDFIVEGLQLYIPYLNLQSVLYHPSPSHCLMLGSFQEAWYWNGFHVSFSQKRLLSQTVGSSSPGTGTVAWCKPCVLERRPCALCGWQQGALGAGAMQPGELATLLLNSSGLLQWVFCCLDEPEGAVTWCLSLSLQSGSRFQNKLEMEVARDKGFSCKCTKEIWMKSWIKELKCMWWGIFLNAHKTNVSLQVISETYML